MTRRVKDVGVRTIKSATYLAFLKTFAADPESKHTAQAFPTALALATIYDYINIAVKNEHLVQAGYDHAGERGPARKAYKITAKGIRDTETTVPRMNDFVR